jgi:NADPH:quinone reductase-like Zn-dependent oxidoreductase
MKTVRAHAFGGPEQLRLEEAPSPEPGPGAVRVRVLAAAVNPVDWKLLSGKSPVQVPLPLTPGGDVAGVIDAVGDGVTGWAVGDEVFTLIGLMGAYAGQIVTDAANLARKPDGLDFIEAASLPLVALTAWQAFADEGRDLDGLHVLIHNAAGGVGIAAVQIAKARGARVLATASPANAEFVRELGADQGVDFRTTPLEGFARDVDIMLDMVGNPEATELWSLVKPGGSVVRVAGGADAPKLAEEDGIRVIKTRVRPNGEQLAQIAALVDSGHLRTEIARTFPLDQAMDAQRLSRDGHVRGKIVLTLE